MVALQHAGLLRSESEGVAPRHQVVDAAEQRLVQVDGVAVLGQAGRHFALDRLQRVVGVRPREVEENRGHAAELAAAPLQRGDGVVEVRHGGICRDRVDPGALLV